MKFSRRALIFRAAIVLAACGLPGVAPAATKSVAYYIVDRGIASAYLIDWKGPDKARVVNSIGAQSGTVADNGTQKLVTLGAPISATFDAFDDCDQAIQQREDIDQVVVRDLKGGVSEVVEIGTLTNIGGCHDGLVTPFGSESDPGTSMKRLAMNARPSMGDIAPGLQIAGPSEEAPWGVFDLLRGSQDVVALGAGTATFQATGHSFPASVDANQWLVFSLSGFQRGYTRLELNAKTAGEVWMVADWSSGKATRVESILFVKPLAGAGFGTKSAASHMWQSGLFIASRQPFFWYLYKDGTGERVFKDLDQGTETRTPITAWGLDGQNLVTQRPFGPGHGVRTWVPLRNEGKAHWVLEGELIFDAPDDFTLINPRVNYLLDTGKAVPPAQAGNLVHRQPASRDLRKLER